MAFDKDLINAAKKGDAAKLSALLGAGSDPQTCNKDGTPVLTLASAAGKLAAVQLLVQAGAQINALSRSQHTALWESLRQGHVDVTQYLLACGANPALGDWMYDVRHPWVLAAAAGDVPLLAAMFSHTAFTVDSETPTLHATALQEAAAHQRFDAASYLLAQGADPCLLCVSNAEVRNAISVAAGLPDGRMFQQLLLACPQGALQGVTGFWAMQAVAENGAMHTLTHLLAAKAPLQWRSDWDAALDPFVLHRIDPSGAVAQAAAVGNVAAIAALLANGASADKGPLEHYSALLLACSHGHSEAVQALLAAGADPDQPDGGGHTPLVHAIGSDHASVVMHLLDAKVTVPAALRNAVLRMTVRRSRVDLMRRMVAQGANINAAQPAGNNPYLINHTPSQDTPLIVAARKEAMSSEMVLALLDAGANPRAVGDEGDTALHLVVLDDAVPLVQRLIALGADVNAVDGEGWTPLSLALRNDHAASAQALLAAGANPRYQDADGYTCLIAAVRGGCTAVLPAIIAANLAHINAQWEGKTALDVAHALEDELRRAEAIKRLTAAGAVALMPSAAPSTVAAPSTESSIPSLDAAHWAQVLATCMPQLDAAQCAEDLRTHWGQASPTGLDASAIFSVLYETLLAQAHIAYEEWREYGGDWLELAPLEGLDLSRYDQDALLDLIAKANDEGRLEAAYEQPYFEYQNHCLKPQGLTMLTLAEENIYALCVLRQPKLIAALTALLAPYGVHVEEHPPMSLAACKKAMA